MRLKRILCWRVFMAVVTIILGIELLAPSIAASPVMAVFPGNTNIWSLGLICSGIARIIVSARSKESSHASRLMDLIFCSLWSYITVFCYLNEGFYRRQFGCAFSLPAAIAEWFLLHRKI